MAKNKPKHPPGCCEFGTYECGVTLKVPDTVKIFKVCGNERKHTVCVDKCLVPAIKALWAAGIPTANSCCGHGVYPPDIFLDPRWIEEQKKKNEKSTVVSFRENVIKRIPLVMKLHKLGLTNLKDAQVRGYKK